MSDRSIATVIQRQPDRKVRVDEKTYQDWYQESIQQPQEFWAKQAERVLSWFQPWDEVYTGDFKTQDIQWFVNGQLNACYNCVDRHLETRAEQIALIWEGSDPQSSQQYTYQALHAEVCRFANVLRAKGIQKGDKVAIYLPMVPQLVFAMLACARIGAIHSVIFSGFSVDALSHRLQDTQAKLLITADEGVRGEKCIPLKKNAEEALKRCPLVQQVIVVRRTTIFGDPKRFIDSYLKPIPGYYLTGDDACRDAEGQFKIAGRNDDVIKVSGHRFGSEELETALASYSGVAEAAVVGLPHEVKGECIVAFVKLMANIKPDEALCKALQQQVRDKIGAVATPEYIYWVTGLPKTRSGKVMRRILRKIAKHEFDDIGDTSTLEDPAIVEKLIAEQKKTG
jgi:acyl-coenzyme A synthetase/AMP-(fatty) acid ligase